MATYSGRVSEVRLDRRGGLEAFIACPPGAVPTPGRYLSAYTPAESDVPLATALFSSQLTPGGFWAAPPIPSSWIPSTDLILRGPLGTGFDLPASVTRLALATLGDSPARLLSLARSALERDCAVTLYTDSPLSGLPSTLEIYPLSSLRESLSWPDLLALDLPLELLPLLRSVLGLLPDDPFPCSIQALIWTSMPCAGLAECGACAVPSRRGYKLACEDGPVFQLSHLEW